MSSNIKSLIKSGGFTKRFNVGGHSGAPEPVLSVISSVDSEDCDSDCDGRMTPIDDFPQEKSKIAGEIGTSSSTPDHTRHDKPLVRTLFGSIPSLISMRSSRRTSSTRSSTATRSSSAMPAIEEAPKIPEFPFEMMSILEDGAIHTTPAQNSMQQAVAVPLLAPPPGFQPVHSSPGSAQSNVSTLVTNGHLLDQSNAIYGSPPPKYTPASHKLPTLPLPSVRGKIESGQSSPIMSEFSKGKESSRFSWPMTHTEKAQSTFTRWFIDWWMFEICCWVFSAICMSIILGVLIRFNGKPIPRWKMGMTLNSFISVLSGFGRAALLVPTAEALGQLKWDWFSKKKSRNMLDFELLDSASRGPWGSFVLLARTKGITLHSVGAAIILLTLPLDLFFQQIVAYPSVNIATTQNATVDRVVQYVPKGVTALISGELMVGINEPTTFSQFDTWFTRAALPVNYTPNCPTGNCTWPQYDTLAVCSSCTDISEMVQFGCQVADGDWLLQADPTLPPPNVTSCGYFLLSGPDQSPVLMAGYSLNEVNEPQNVLSSRFYNTMDLQAAQYSIPNGSFKFKNIQNPIVDFLVSVTPDGTAGTLRNATPVVSECVLHWCVQTLKVQYTSGVFTENIINQRFLNTNDAENPWPDTDTYLPAFDLTLPDPLSPNGSSTYGMSNGSARAVVGSAMTFVPSMWVQNLTEFRLDTPEGRGILQKFSLFRSSYYVVPNTNIFRSAPASDLMSGLAKTLSNVIRTSMNVNATELTLVRGQAWVNQTLVKLRWEWATLPAAMLLFSLVFLITTVVQSSKEANAVGIWKTSALAVLFNGLGDEILDGVGSKMKMGEARKKAKALSVQLSEN